MLFLPILLHVSVALAACAADPANRGAGGSRKMQAHRKAQQQPGGDSASSNNIAPLAAGVQPANLTDGGALQGGQPQGGQLPGGQGGDQGTNVAPQQKGRVQTGQTPGGLAGGKSQSDQSQSGQSQGGQPQGGPTQGDQSQGGQPQGDQPQGGQPQGGDQTQGGQPQGGPPQEGQPQRGQPQRGQAQGRPSSVTSALPSQSSPPSTTGGSSTPADKPSTGGSIKASFTAYGGGDSFGSASCNTATSACGWYTNPGYNAAVSQSLFGVGPGAGAGPACGLCFKLFPETGTSIVVKVNNLCPADGNPLCSQPKDVNVNFDLCKDDGAAKALFGAAEGQVNGTASEVDCGEWSGGPQIS